MLLLLRLYHTIIYHHLFKQYHHLLQNAVTTTYKKCNKETERKINCEGIKYTKEANILDKVELNGTANCFITLKDHKANFLNHPTTRLINPAKNEIGRISKQILDQINSKLCEILKVNEWKNTANVINWFKKVESKNSHKFLMFDIKDFYPSIKEDLLIEALEFAKHHVTIKPKDRETIFHARKSLLYNEGEPWIKKQSNSFDVTMGSYDGAEVCELIGIFMLSLIGNKYNPNNIGLYRDDGLAVFKNTSGPQSEKIKKTFQRMFKNKGLDIIINCNMKIVNYLDVTLNLNDGSYRPYKKPNEETNYIHVNSDHPPSILKQLPKSIEKRLSSLSSSKEIFEETAPYYEQQLSNCGYKEKLNYRDPTPQNLITKRKRQRNILWFNPPYSKTVKTKIGKFFLQVIKKHFPKEHKFHKIFNRNTLKLSYSCMPNIKTKINAHNREILRNTPSKNTKHCNCQQKENCPMNGACLKESLVYYATISCNDKNYQPKLYKGSCETSFKKRYSNHKKSFNVPLYKHDTKLSTEYWNLKTKQLNPRISWKIKGIYKSYNPTSKRCNLCLTEKLEILDDPDKNLLNKRSEIISQCRHKNKFRLKTLASSMTSDGIT